MVLGVVGVFLPVMPTVVFMISAAACYAEGSPALREKLLAHPTFGPPVRDWLLHRAVTTRAKVFGIIAATLGIGISMLFLVKLLWLRLVLFAIWLGIVVFMLAVKTRHR